MKHQNITAEIVADSINPHDKRLTSYILKYPRFIHAELMTHRMLSRNSASSRAIPIKKAIREVWNNPAHPERWGINGRGMQDHGLHKYPKTCMFVWRSLSKVACASAWVLDKLGLHKQIANRVLEPFSHITVLVTATNFNNFFRLRAHPDAQPEFQVLAYRMLAEYRSVSPKPLTWGEWHLPLAPKKGVMLQHLRTISVANAARTSYTAFRKDRKINEQRKLCDKLSSGGHWSPFEHQAQAVESAKASGNFRGGWLQNREIEERSAQTVGRKLSSMAEVFSEKPEWISV